jgi:hypothetical protein
MAASGLRSLVAEPSCTTAPTTAPSRPSLPAAMTATGPPRRRSQRPRTSTRHEARFVRHARDLFASAEPEVCAEPAVTA